MGELFAKVNFQKYVFVLQFFQNIEKILLNIFAKANVFSVKGIIWKPTEWDSCF